MMSSPWVYPITLSTVLLLFHAIRYTKKISKPPRWKVVPPTTERVVIIGASSGVRTARHSHGACIDFYGLSAWGSFDTLVICAGVSSVRPVMEIAGYEPSIDDSIKYSTREGVKQVNEAMQRSLQGNFTAPVLSSV